MWQLMHTSEGRHVYLRGAFLDTRPFQERKAVSVLPLAAFNESEGEILEAASVLRVILTVDAPNRKEFGRMRLFCLFW